MGKVLGLQVVSAVVISLVLNAPVLLVNGGTGRTVVLAVVAVLLVLSAVSALGHRGQPRQVTTTVASGVGTHVTGPEPTDLAHRVRRRQRLARFQGPALLIGLVGGSLAGASLGSWWWEALGGAVGYGLVSGLVLWVLDPRRLLSGPRRPPRPGAPGLR